MTARLDRYLILLCTLLIVGCASCYDSPKLDSDLPVATCSIEELRDYVGFSSHATLLDDIIIRGRITSSDAENNFYKSITVEDSTGGVELLVNQYRLHREYPEGLEVALALKGCAAEYRYGVLTLGGEAQSYDNFFVDYLGSQVAIDRVIRRGHDVLKLKAKRRTLGELDRSMCGEFTRIESLKLVSSTSIDTLVGETLESARWIGYATFTDMLGDTILVYTSEYAKYADHHIPHSQLSIEGILQMSRGPYDRSYYSLKMRYEEDCIID